MDAISQRHQHSMNTTAVEESFYMSDAVVTVWQDHHLVSTVAVVYCKVLWCSWLNSYWHLNHSIAPSASAMDVTLQSHACLLQQRDWSWGGYTHATHEKLRTARSWELLLLSTWNSHSALQPIFVLAWNQKRWCRRIDVIFSWELQLFPRRNTLSLNIQNWHLSFFNVIHKW